MKELIESAKSIVGDYWTMGTAANPVIQKCINHGLRLLRLESGDSLAKVNPTLMISIEIAEQISTSEEIHFYLKENSGETGVYEGPFSDDKTGCWVIPNSLYGVDIVFVLNIPEKTAKLLTSPGVFTFTEVIP